MSRPPASAKRESKSVDFKRSFDPSIAADCCEIVKDIVAMANSGGGTILVGVANDGSCSNDPTVAAVLSLDPAHLTDKVAKYTGVQFDGFSVSEETRDGHQIAQISIRAAESPMVFESPGTYQLPDQKQKTAFSRGTLYVRHGAKSEPATTEDLRRIIERHLRHVRREWMTGVRKVVNAPVGAAVSVLPPNVQQSSDPAAIPIRITSDPRAPEYRLVDPDVTHPWRQKELVAEVNRALPGEASINQFDVQAIRHLYSIDANEQFFHKRRFGAPQYSPALYQWLLEQYGRDPQFFQKGRVEFKRRRQG